MLRIIQRIPTERYLCTLPVKNPKLHRTKDQRDITNMDLLEEQIRIKSAEKNREMTIQGQKVKWAYRSELVGRHDLDKNHRNTWMAYLIIILVGFGAFVTVKSQVVMGRRQEMDAREALRKELQLSGDDRKKIGVV
ncbi:Cytochrome c oxidase assembly protein COX20, mitochondrial [Caenorhabditis elegans]|uniref:Cytochrome c oxidase assembly protein COX20, mitochondrial n=2 Tax=Caenorhabditis elegans TaxID=6239 RepID=Q18196_CAEEL|nr:Cytochrome c oxidase assembly protein COX20, mitochondrial [Caenorhabditis elegans]CCD65199.1 Cytochrome c oxidase assembly protein COX20, mitochondrial [Caenorhabditis elegans]|eukprot:NP_501342.1 Uncharacterized protein CELE_C26B2.7 [Caenorhabditis elegans]